MPMASASAMPAMKAKDWKTLWRILSYSPLPYCIEMAAPLPMQRPSRMLPVMGPDVNVRCTGQISPFLTSQQNFIRYSLGVQCFISRKILIK